MLDMKKIIRVKEVNNGIWYTNVPSIIKAVEKYEELNVHYLDEQGNPKDCFFTDLIGETVKIGNETITFE